MVSQLLKLLLVGLPAALAVSQTPDHVSVTYSASASSSEAHSESARVSFTTNVPINGTAIPDKSGGNNTHTNTTSPKKTGARKVAGYYPVYHADGQSPSELRYGQCSARIDIPSLLISKLLHVLILFSG